MSKRQRKMRRKAKQEGNAVVEAAKKKMVALEKFRASVGSSPVTNVDLGNGKVMISNDPDFIPDATVLSDTKIDEHTNIIETDKGIAVIGDSESKVHAIAHQAIERAKESEGAITPEGFRAAFSEATESVDFADDPTSAEHQQSASVDGYFECVRYAYDGWHRRHEGAVTWGRPFNTEEFTRHLYAMLRRARLVHIPLNVYGTLYRQNDVRLTLDAGYPWSPPDPSKADPYIVQRVSDVTKQAMSELPFPERLPFDCVYFAFGGGIELTREQTLIKTGEERARSLQGAVLIALLLGSHGVCVEFLAGHHIEHGEMIFAVCHRTWGEDRWLPSTEPGVPQDLAPFMATSLVEHVNSFVELSVSTPHSKQHRKDWRRGRKKLGVNKGEPPPEFYPYKLRSTLHRETDGDGGDGIVRTYRTDVRGHERLLVRRGDLPLPLRKREYYKTQDFKVFETEPPPPELREKLRVKGHPSKLRHEWMVVKSIWIDPHLNSNDESLPYVKRLNVA